MRPTTARLPGEDGFSEETKAFLALFAEHPPGTRGGRPERLVPPDLRSSQTVSQGAYGAVGVVRGRRAPLPKWLFGFQWGVTVARRSQLGFPA